MGQAYLFIHFIAAKELGKGIFAFLQPPSRLELVTEPGAHQWPGPYLAEAGTN